MATRTRTTTARFELRCSPDELAAWRRTARGHGLTLAAYIRVCLNRGAMLSRTAKVDPALVRQAAAIGNNLNQIAYWCNARKAKQDIRLVEEGIRHAREALERLLRAGGQQVC
ncbi:MAG: MobC family plasmid mobilization relaxosome protein [Desulfovibrionaceae bacterium]|nr:MobC family plasmid mobilization relaxosome protein [Desulfovibrionaceae bacterium]